MLLSHGGEYGGEYGGEWLTNPIRHDHKVIARHSYVFVSIRGRSWGVGNIRNMLKIFARKAYSHTFRNIFVSNRKPFLLVARHLY
jgi:hypothetical protein